MEVKMSRTAPERTPSPGTIGILGTCGIYCSTMGQTMMSNPIDFRPQLFNSDYNYNIPNKEKCPACGQWGSPKSECNYCGHPIDG